MCSREIFGENENANNNYLSTQYALVHSIKDKCKATYVLDTCQIKDFKLDDRTFKMPHFAEHEDHISGNKYFAPIQIHFVSNDYEEVQQFAENKTERLKFFNLNESQAEAQIEKALKKKEKKSNEESMKDKHVKHVKTDKVTKNKTKKKDTLKSTDNDILKDLEKKIALFDATNTIFQSKANDEDEKEDLEQGKSDDKIMKQVDEREHYQDQNQDEIKELQEQLQKAIIEKENLTTVYDMKFRKMNEEMSVLRKMMEINLQQSHSVTVNISPSTRSSVEKVDVLSEDKLVDQLSQRKIHYSSDSSEGNNSKKRKASLKNATVHNGKKHKISEIKQIIDKNMAVISLPDAKNSNSAAEDSPQPGTSTGNCSQANLLKGENFANFNEDSLENGIVDNTFANFNEDSHENGIVDNTFANFNEDSHENGIVENAIQQNNHKNTELKRQESLKSTMYKKREDSKSTSTTKNELEINFEGEKDRKMFMSGKEKRKRRKGLKRKNARKSDHEYDSDNFKNENENNFSDFQTWKKEVYPKDKNGQDIRDDFPKVVKMLHLRFGVSIPYQSYFLIQKQKTPSKFLKKLARAIYTQYDLLNRSFFIHKCGSNLDGRSPRKDFTPVKKAVLRKLYFAFVNKHIVLSQDRKKARKEWKAVLGDYINYLRKRYRAGYIRKPDSNSSSESSTGSEKNSLSETDN